MRQVESDSVPQAVATVVSQFESCDSREDYLKTLRAFESDAKSNPQLAQSLSTLSAQYQSLEEASGPAVAKSLREQFSKSEKAGWEVHSAINLPELSFLPLPQQPGTLAGVEGYSSGGLNLVLDTESREHVKEELKRTYDEQNIGCLANRRSLATS